MKDELIAREAWRMRPWAIALLILTAVAFGAQLVLVGIAFLTIATGVMLASWTALLIMGIRKRNTAAPNPGREAGG